MSDASAMSMTQDATPSSGFVYLIAPALLSASVLYFSATAAVLPPISDASAAIDVFLAAMLPALVVIMLLWAARPAAFPRRRRRSLVAITLLSSAAAAILPILVWVA